MKRIIAMTTAALMGASVFAAPALAQNPSGAGTDQDFQLSTEQGTSADAPMDERAMTPDVDTGTTASIDGSYDGALAAIGGSSMNARSVASMETIETINVVRVGELQGDAGLIDQAVSQNQAGVDELRAAIDANSALQSELQTRGVNSASVVGAEVGAMGELTLYVL